MRQLPTATERTGLPDGLESADDPLFVQSVGRAMAVLSAFGGATRPLSLGEIAQAARVTRSAAQRLVHTLRRLGYIKRDEAGRGFVLGVRSLEFSRDYLRMNPLIARATPVLQDLRRSARERIDLSLFDDLRLVYAVRMQSKRETFFASLVGYDVPVFCTSGGRAVMAHLPDSRVADILARSDRRPFTDKTVVATDDIMRLVREARQDGYALAVEEVLVGEIALGVAILGPNGPVAALHLIGSLSEWTPSAFRQRYAPLAVEAANAINRG